MRKIVLLFVVLFSLTSVSLADDLYRVTVQNSLDAAALSKSGVDVLVRLNDGYLILADQQSVSRLGISGLSSELITSDVARDQLVLDLQPRLADASPYPLLFEEGQLRVFRLAATELATLPQPSRYGALPLRQPKIEHTRPAMFKPATTMIDLDSLISFVDLDSLQSYVEILQAFYRRNAGSQTNYDSRDWIAAQFASFDYDSVVIDSFIASISGTPTECQNVIAYKLGTNHPNQQVVVGAHRDAVPTSPGADDNGSGTAGVLEIARVLQNIETDMTFIFILFDAEENGLLGSYDYVARAAAREDSIIYMLNMDMIAFEPNTTQAEIYHGSDATFSQLWQTLASSLVGITGTLVGNTSGSDHYPFTQQGYPASFVAEYIFSSVYHSSRDSTTYLDFAYMTKLVKASLATVYQVSQTAAPQPRVTFAYPGGIPSMLLPNETTTFEVVVSGAWEGQPVSGSGQLHYSIDGGAYNSVSMMEISPDHYEAVLPATACNGRFAYYVSAEEMTVGTYYDPDPSNPQTAVVATGAVEVFADDFETATGWTVSGDATDGQWGRGTPVGGGTRGDPPTDFDGSGSCYLTDNVAGNSDVDGGTTYLTSPTFDLTVGDAQIHYARWYSNDFGADPQNDVFQVFISNNNGVDWELVETVGPTGEVSGGWYEHSFWAADIITPLTANMKMQFVASDLAGGSVIEAAIDDFTVTFYECESCDCTGFCDLNLDGAINPVDVVYLANYVYRGLDGREVLPWCPLENGDWDCNGAVNPVDVVYYVNLVYRDQGDGPCDPCTE